MLFGFGEIALHQIGFTEVFVRAAVPRIERQSLLIVLHCRIELPQTAIGVAEIVLDIGIAGIAKPGRRECLDRAHSSRRRRSLACLPRNPDRALPNPRVSTIDPMVEQIGHASAGVTVSETALPARAGVAARSCRAGAVKKYDAGTAANIPTTAAIRIERIMIVVPLAGCRTSAPGSRSTHSLPRQFYRCIKEALASLISTRSASASLVISARFRK